MEAQRPFNFNIYPNLPNHPNHSNHHNHPHHQSHLNHPIHPRATNGIHHHDQVLPQHQETFKTYKMKAVLSQCLAALAIFAVNFSSSNFVLTLLLSENSKYLGFNPYDTYRIAVIVGYIVGGVLAHKAGGRVIIVIGGIFLSVGLLSRQLDPSTELLKWVIHIVALSTGIMGGPSYVYLAEISQPNMRSSLMTLPYLSPIIGWYFYAYLMKVTSLKTTGYINVIFPFFGSIVLFLLPDSPYFLANKERYGQVELSLTWFRGWTLSANVKSESATIINRTQMNQRQFKLKTLYIPAVIICYVFIIQSFIGMNFISLLPFTDRIPGSFFEEKYKIDLLYNIGNVVPLVVFFFVVAMIGKRTMILLSLLTVSITLYLSSTIGYLYRNDVLSANFYSWSLVVCLVLTRFFFNLGIAQVPLILNGELFPSRFRNIGAGLGLFFVHMATWGTDKLYLDSSFYGFALIAALASVSMFGFISLIWLFPRNENKTLVEIEESSNSIDSLRRKK